MKQLLRADSPERIGNNRTFHQMLIEGINISYQKGGNLHGDLVWPLDFDTPENNDFHVTNRFSVVENSEQRPDVVLFINGFASSNNRAQKPDRRTGHCQIGLEPITNRQTNTQTYSITTAY